MTGYLSKKADFCMFCFELKSYSVILCDMKTYLLFAILYATLIGVYNVFKKKATEKSNESVIFVMFTFV